MFFSFQKHYNYHCHETALIGKNISARKTKPLILYNAKACKELTGCI